MSPLVAERPVPGPPRPFHFPEFERRPAGPGELLSCHLPGRPLVTLALLAPSGAAAEVAGLAGLSDLLVRALGEGSTGKDAVEFAVAGERLGADWWVKVDWDATWVGFDVPTAELTGAAGLLAEVMRTPGLRPEDVSRVRASAVDELRVEANQPVARAGLMLAGALFTEPSRYALGMHGRPETVAGLNRQQVADLLAARFQPARTALVVAGDLTGVDLGRLAERVYGGWSPVATGESAGPSAFLPAGGGREVVLVDRPGSVQSALLAGHVGPSRNVADYVAATTMSACLGGLFGSRLNYRLREEKGYCYGAFAAFDARRDGGVFLAQANVHTEVTVDAARDLVGEIVRMHEHGVSEAELAIARSYRAGVFPIQFASSAATARALGHLVVFGWPDDYYDRLRADIESVPLEAVNAAAAERLRPQDLVLVVVGDAERVGDQLDAADLGPVRRVPF